MSRSEETRDGARGTEQPEDAAQQRDDVARQRAEHEARDFSAETGYRPSVNQRRHEPLPASSHDERHQEAIVRNQEHARGDARAVPSRRARRGSDGKR